MLLGRVAQSLQGKPPGVSISNIHSQNPKCQECPKAAEPEGRQLKIKHLLDSMVTSPTDRFQALAGPAFLARGSSARGSSGAFSASVCAW